jgi:hypothetical protein
LNAVKDVMLHDDAYEPFDLRLLESNRSEASIVTCIDDWRQHGLFDIDLLIDRTFMLHIDSMVEDLWQHDFSKDIYFRLQHYWTTDQINYEINAYCQAYIAHHGHLGGLKHLTNIDLFDVLPI